MKKIGFSDSEKRLLVLLGCLLLLAGSYFFVFQKYSDKAAAVEEENKAAAATVQKLEMMVGRQKEVEQETADCMQAVEKVTAKYPSDITTEKAIATIQDIEEHSGAEVTTIDFNMNNLVGNLDELAGISTSAAADSTETESADGGATEAGAVPARPQAGYYASLTMNYEASYEQMKAMTAYIAGLADRTTVSEISASYDEATGKLAGMLTVHMYYLTDTGKECEAPAISGVQSGVSDIFHSGGVSAESFVPETISGGNGGDANGSEQETE